jgi:hypothetical protein
MGFACQKNAWKVSGNSLMDIVDQTTKLKTISTHRSEALSLK